jgi:hypothetical protein
MPRPHEPLRSPHRAESSRTMAAMLIGFEGTLELPPRFDLTHRSGLPNLRRAVVEQFAPSLLLRQSGAAAVAAT